MGEHSGPKFFRATIPDKRLWAIDIDVGDFLIDIGDFFIDKGDFCLLRGCLGTVQQMQVFQRFSWNSLVP